MSSLYSFYFIFFPCPMSHFSVPHLIIPYFFQMSRAWRPGRTPGFPYSAQQDAPGNARRPGRLFWGFYLCFLVGGLLILLGEEVQLRIRGGCRACYREVRPLAVIDLINVYFTTTLNDKFKYSCHSHLFHTASITLSFPIPFLYHKFGRSSFSHSSSLFFSFKKGVIFYYCKLWK